MRILLDTHVVVWALADTDRLGSWFDVLADAANSRLVSSVVGWEIAVKWAIGGLELGGPPDTWLPEQMRVAVMDPVPIEFDQVLGVASLPHHHGDPFDRLLVSQARALRLPIMTADPAFDAYDVEVLAVR